MTIVIQQGGGILCTTAMGEYNFLSDMHIVLWGVNDSSGLLTVVRWGVYEFSPFLALILYLLAK